MADAVIRNERLEQAVASIDYRKLVLSFDQDSDTLMVHFFGRGTPGVSVPMKDDPTGDWMVRLHRETGEPIGFQVEHVMSRNLPRHPILHEILQLAEVRPENKRELEAQYGESEVLSAIHDLACEYEMLALAAD